jgi:hypothetical protein
MVHGLDYVNYYEGYIYFGGGGNQGKESDINLHAIFVVRIVKGALDARDSACNIRRWIRVLSFKVVSAMIPVSSRNELHDIGLSSSS